MKIRVDKRRWLRTVALICGIFMMLSLICCISCAWIGRLFPALDAADRWKGSSELSFTQVACYLPINQGYTEADIVQFQKALSGALVENSLSPPEGGRLFSDSWSAEAELTISGTRGSSTAWGIGVGGNYFLFHPLRLLSGSYFSPDDLMNDRVVLDEELAWGLFGSSNVAGMEVSIGGRPFIVAGVVEREDDFASKKAYQNGPGLFLPYGALFALTEQKISCYEIVLPDLVSGFGVGLVEEYFDLRGGDLVDNSTRHSVSSLLKVVGDFGIRSMQKNGVVFPYWENAARMAEDYMALLLAVGVLFAIFPCTVVLILLLRLITSVFRKLRKTVPEVLDEIIERKKRKRYRQRHDHATKIG